MLARLLSDGRLRDIHKDRKASITVEGNDAEELLRNVTRNLPIQDELAKLLSQTFKLDDEHSGRKAERSRSNPDKKEEREKRTFMPERYPSVFRIDARAANGDAIPMVKVPIGGEWTITLLDDVEDIELCRVQER